MNGLPTSAAKDNKPSLEPQYNLTAVCSLIFAAERRRCALSVTATGAGGQCKPVGGKGREGGGGQGRGGGNLDIVAGRLSQDVVDSPEHRLVVPPCSLQASLHRWYASAAVVELRAICVVGGSPRTLPFTQS